jgi:hypothetical protein
MKRFVALLLILTMMPGAALLGQASGGDGSDSAEAESPAPREVARQASRDAARDAGDYTPSWWGFGGFAASMLISPLIGGGIVTLVGYTVEGDVQVPAMRMVEVEERYGDDYRLLDVYEEEYEDTYGKIKKQRQGGRALLGTGIAFGLYVALYAAILASY